MSFKVVVADNFHYMDEGESHEHGTFGTLELAIESAKGIVEQYLASAYKPRMSAEALYDSYTSFGEDAHIVAPGSTGVLFSAWSYAKERCRVICSSGT